MFRPRKLDMEMSPDTLEVVGVNELFLVVGVDASSTVEQAASGSLGTHRVIKVNKDKDTFDLSDWWKSNCTTLPGFTYVLNLIDVVVF